MSQALTKAVTVLVAVMLLINAQCLAACALEPCRAAAPHVPAKKASVPPCHQTTGDQQEPQRSDDPSCSDEAFASESVAKVSLPENLPAATVALLPISLTPDARLLRIAVTDSSPPLTRVLVSSTVLRI